eukprot:TRINITY_DN13746_c0_g1_i4.p1 TRINITY_DN13746_c0_g1~~TRINITY_DN13746_c0_g1_i4.p1  ORF type:complete len:738 (+),score=62.05 TRINITY_DN13746_c0_g1_i4:40-2253(+)
MPKSVPRVVPVFKPFLKVSPGLSQNMPRKNPVGAAAASDAQRFMARILQGKQEYCCVTHETILKRREMIKNCQESSSEAFLKALTTYGWAVKTRRRISKTRSWAWCLNCAHKKKSEKPHTTHTKKKRRCSSPTEEEDSSTSDDQSTNGRNDELSTDGGDDELSTSSGELSSETSNTVSEPSKYSAKAYCRLHRKYHSLQKKIDESPTMILNSKTGGYSPGVIASIQYILSHGIGSRSAGQLLSQIVYALAGVQTKGSGDGISGNTVKAIDSFAGDLATARFLDAAAEAEPAATSLQHDASSGARQARGLKFSTVAVGVPHPKNEGKVIQAVVDSSWSTGGSSASKALQIERAQDKLVESGLPLAEFFVSDHEPSALAASSQTDLITVGCFSHKLKHCVEAADFVLEGRLSQAIPVLHTALGSGTVNTTGSCIKVESHLRAAAGGSAPRNIRFERQVGSKYCWLLQSAFQVLSNRDILIAARDRGDLVIPGSTALDDLLNEDNIPNLTAASACFALFPAAMQLLRGGGDVSAAYYSEVTQKLKTYLQQLSSMTKEKLPDWLSPELHALLQKYWSIQARKLIREAAGRMTTRLEHILKKDSSLESVELEKLKSVPLTNDFVEGSHGSLGTLLSRLPGTNPARVAQNVVAKHNQKALREFGIRGPASQEEIDSVRSKSKLPCATAAWNHVYRSHKAAQLRSRLVKMRVAEVRNEAEELDLPCDGLNKVDLVNLIIKHTLD